MDNTCDVFEVRGAGMRKAQAKVRELRAAGIPVSSEMLSRIMKLSFAEARSECSPMSYDLTPEQLKLLKAVCEPCAERFTVKS